MSDATRPLRVLHLNTERGWRGGERQTVWLADALQRLGTENYVAARPDEPLAERARQAGLAVIRCAPFGEWDLRAALRLRRRMRRLRIDVVHAHTAHAAALAALATAGTPVPFVASRRVVFRLRRNPFTRWKYARASAVVAISEAVRRTLVADGIAPERIAVVHSGIDLSRRIEPASAELLRALAVPEGVPLVVQVAHLTAEKDPVTFVRAVAAARRQVPALHALLVGGGPLAAAVRAEAAALGVADIVHLAGVRADADRFVAAADVVTLTSRQEGLGSVLLDALMLGRPVVATRAGGTVEVIEHGVSGLLAPVGDAEQLGALVARVLTDGALAARLRAAGGGRAAEFSTERTAQRTLEVYRQVLAGAGVTGGARDPSAE
ncbi:MAG TPA: glycosyltransferase [Gemmatimonadaceae bacterium]|nr:glycosyltransferase [Gemmatimonadaceae bacterium]